MDIVSFNRAFDNRIDSPMWIRSFTSPSNFRKHLTYQISKSIIFMNLLKTETETDARRQNSQMNFCLLPNAETPNVHGFKWRDLCKSDYQMLHKWKGMKVHGYAYGGVTHPPRSTMDIHCDADGLMDITRPSPWAWTLELKHQPQTYTCEGIPSKSSHQVQIDFKAHMMRFPYMTTGTKDRPWLH